MADPADPSSPAPDDSRPRYRSGAVARMLRMPVATLRIWERRYRIAAPATTPSGHRLYSAADVQRLVLVKQLLGLGHAVGSLASLDIDALRAVAATHAHSVAAAPAAAAADPGQALQVVVVGGGLAERLQRPALHKLLHRPLALRAADTLAAALPAGPAAPAQLLLWHTPGLHQGQLAELRAAAKACGARRIGVLYGYAPLPVRDSFTAVGVAVQREPLDDRALAAWLRSLCHAAPADAAAAADAEDHATLAEALLGALGRLPPPRYDVAALSDFAGLSSTIACECPRHVAELLMQLSQFEAYSAECRHRSAHDAALHDYLRQVAGASRALFELALERVAREEGLPLQP